MMHFIYSQLGYYSMKQICSQCCGFGFYQDFLRVLSGSLWRPLGESSIGVKCQERGSEPSFLHSRPHLLFHAVQSGI